MKGIARNQADHDIPTVTFNMTGAGKSTGRPSLTGFYEVSDVVAVKWTSQNLWSNRILLVGSSGGTQILDPLQLNSCLHRLMFKEATGSEIAVIFTFMIHVRIILYDL
ncbi:hypothetical protein L2E82_46582 [Cichorium intybus]|uniref:Uncharacterized protein n=1 Tax=Cichorium intybus TaxID=13427 RepID=A0ACB8YU34_CICIN|nr:hypothetical protein L1887_26294 [Cichorium endivia]KAI3688767.1 hypothetical protein L2E82_46582 [Cichorium intybus]